MKQLFTRLFSLILLFEMSCTMQMLNAQTQISNAPQTSYDFLLSVQNLAQTATNKLEFDVYLLNTLPVDQTFELATIQLGFLINASIHTGGTLTLSLDNSSSELDDMHQFQYVSNPKMVLSQLTSYPSKTLIRQQGRTDQGVGYGSIISSDLPGTKLIHYTLTNSVNFIANSVPDLSFISTSEPSSELYKTSITENINELSTNLSVISGVNAIVYGNPVLNSTATGFTSNGNNSGNVIYSKDKNIILTCSQVIKQVYIYNTLGSIVKMVNNVKGSNTFNMSNYPNEYYFVKTVTDNEVYTQKVLLR